MLHVKDLVMEISSLLYNCRHNTILVLYFPADYFLLALLNITPFQSLTFRTFICKILYEVVVNTFLIETKKLTDVKDCTSNASSFFLFFF